MRREPISFDLEVAGAAAVLRERDNDPIIVSGARDPFHYKILPTYVVHGNATFKKKRTPTSLLGFSIETDGDFDTVVARLKITMTFSDEEGAPLSVYKVVPGINGYKIDARAGSVQLGTSHGTKLSGGVSKWVKIGVGHSWSKNRTVKIPEAEFYTWVNGKSNPSKASKRPGKPVVDSAIWAFRGEVEQKLGVPPVVGVAVVLQRPCGNEPKIWCRIEVQNSFKFISTIEWLRGRVNTATVPFDAVPEENDPLDLEEGIEDKLEKCTEEPLMKQMVTIGLPEYYSTTEDDKANNRKQPGEEEAAGRGDAGEGGDEPEQGGGGDGGEDEDARGEDDEVDVVENPDSDLEDDHGSEVDGD